MGFRTVFQHIWNHPSNRNARVRTIWRSACWQLRKRWSSNPHEVSVYRSSRVILFPESLGASVLVYSSFWPDYDEMHFLQRYLRPGDSFLDIGANVGIYSLLANEIIGETGSLRAFEPGDQAFSWLEENFRLNNIPDDSCCKLVVSDQVGAVGFTQDKDLVNSLDAQAGKIPSTTLDTITMGQSYAVGKIDVEGAEPLIFRAGQSSLKSHSPPIWLLETKERLLKKYGFTLDDLVSPFRNAGYVFATYSADENALVLRERLLDGSDNTFAIAREIVPVVAERIGCSIDHG